MKPITFLIFLNSLISITVGFGIQHHEATSECTSRYIFREQMRHEFPGCEELIRHNPLCGKDIDVTYSEFPPYIYKKNGKAVGILPGLLKSAIETCCYGCNNITYHGPFGNWEKFLFKNSTLVMPAQTSTNNKVFFDHDYIHMIEVKGVSFIGPVRTHDPKKMMKTIVTSIFNTWPLFVIAFIMAVVAGISIWILDNSWKEKEFHSSFPRGPFEGFWWAVVSMTTVGYGDRAPKSTIGRIFAILWIIIGITIFSMYSASLTSALTTAIITSYDVSLYQKTVGVLNSTTVGMSGATKLNAKYQEYSGVEAIAEALEHHEIQVAGLDDNIINFFIDDLVEHGIPEVSLYERINMQGFSYGMVSFDSNLTRLFRSFYESNDEQRDLMLKDAIEGLDEHEHESIVKTESPGAIEVFTSTKMFIISVGALVGMAVILTVLGLGCKWSRYTWRDQRSKKHDRAVEINAEEIYLTDEVHKDEEILTLVAQLQEKLIERKKQV